MFDVCFFVSAEMSSSMLVGRGEGRGLSPLANIVVPNYAPVKPIY